MPDKDIIAEKMKRIEAVAFNMDQDSDKVAHIIEILVEDEEPTQLMPFPKKCIVPIKADTRDKLVLAVDLVSITMNDLIEKVNELVRSINDTKDDVFLLEKTVRNSKNRGGFHA